MNVIDERKTQKKKKRKEKRTRATEAIAKG